VSRGRGSRTLSLIAAMTDILQQIQPASVRAVCYRLFVRSLIPNMCKSSTNSVSRLLTITREEGEIPWEWIVDESREAESVSSWSNPDEIISAAVRGYRRDYWQDQPYRVEVWSEKGTVRGTLGPVLNEYGVTFRVMHRYASATVINDIANLAHNCGKPLIALYVGDWDPSGKHMSDVDLPSRLKSYGEGGDGDVRLTRVALDWQDLDKLPNFDPDSKRQDPRYAWFQKAVGTECYELDAMPPPELRARVEEHIRGFIDLEKWNHARFIEQAEVQSMEDVHKSWLATICTGSPR
jgi:hypothetical protein